ncbi:hypothetical protein QBC36DRAFT_131607 [Triangularia setosa]|uniref:Uncharacterized protein n=1 Tax=Triangularia setosa TaxID=2587417 RepID=A0AAN6WC52_9PEZI|nr:hypothetical protein QBC36DRAFT_131607 [Podospora setosa]
MRITSLRHAAVWVACLSHHVAAVKHRNPAEGAARKNAYEIFNAIHSAMRQWGSSLNHNGLSTFVATVPAGVTLYHGTWRTAPPPGPEWLAFEIEHAEMFAHARMRFPPPAPNTTDSFIKLQRQRGIFFQGQSDYQARNDDEDDDTEGHLQLYRTTKPIRLLYIDGMSAGNTEMGTLDFQDFVLRGDRHADVWDELDRAKSLCDVVTGWGLQGVIRMEAGFEIIQCDFSDSLELVSVTQRPSEPRGGLGWEGYSEVHPIEFVRAVAQRYHGIGASRVALDFSSMVSAMFYPVALSNENMSNPSLPRLRHATDEELHVIRARVEEVVYERLDGKQSSINWQEVADLIVGRYADRIWFMAERAQFTLEILGELNHLTNTHVDYGAEKDGYRAALSRCERHYLSSVTPRTPEDRLILAAMEEVTHAICERLYAVRLYIEHELGYKYNYTAPAAHEDKVLHASKRSIKHLMENLKWTRWKECTTCGFHEVCFVPMWPFGDKDSYEQPNCRDLSSITNGWWENRYWDMPKMRHSVKPPSKEDL